MRITADVENSQGQHRIKLKTGNSAHSITVPPKPNGFGSSANGGEPLFLALATCYYNDIYREAAKKNIKVERVLFGGSLFGMIVPGPKLRDLRRDARYALHSETCPPPRHDDAFYITGVVRKHSDPRLWDSVAAQMLAERRLSEPWLGFDRQILVEFLIGSCLVTLTMADRGLPAGHTVWHAHQ